MQRRRLEARRTKFLVTRKNFSPNFEFIINAQIFLICGNISKLIAIIDGCPYSAAMFRLFSSSNYPQPAFLLVLIWLAGISAPAAPLADAGLLPGPEQADRAAAERILQDLAQKNHKPRLVVMEALISLDGQARPDLGASFADTLTAKLLKDGQYEILDASALHPTSPEVKLTLPTPIDFGQTVGADFVIVPTLIGTQGEFRLTVKKLKLPGGRLEKIVQETARGDQRLIFALAEKCSAQLAPPVEEKPFEPSITYIRAWMAPPVKLDPLVAAVKKAPKALKGNGSLAGAITNNKVAQAYTTAGVEQQPRRLGQILTVDDKWSFCELSLPTGSVKLKDQLFGWSADPSATPISLTVSRIDGSRIIADYDATNAQHLGLHPGLAVYQWQAPQPK